jgi:hypothetical protein
LEDRLRPDGRAVSGQEYVWVDGRQVKPRLAALAEEGWRRLRAGDGAKGPRWDAWRWRPLAAPLAPGWCRWLLVRRRLNDPTDLTAYMVFAPQATTLEEVVPVAGSRWTIERGFEAAKGEVGLDHDEGRTWTGWYRHSTLAMWALALLTIMRAGTIAVAALKKSRGPPREASPLATFKAGRGLPSRSASPSCIGCCGGWSWPCRRPPVPFSVGRNGVAGTRAPPKTPTRGAVRRSWGVVPA